MLTYSHKLIITDRIRLSSEDMLCHPDEGCKGGKNCSKTDNNEGRHPTVSWDQLRSSSHIWDHLCLLAKTTAACTMRQFYFQTLSAILVHTGHFGQQSLGFVTLAGKHSGWSKSLGVVLRSQPGSRGVFMIFLHVIDLDISPCSTTLAARA